MNKVEIAHEKILSSYAVIGQLVHFNSLRV